MFSIRSQKAFSSHRDSGGFTCSFKNIPRDKNATWGNRFVKDHNDLDYEANPQSIASRMKKSAKNKNSLKGKDEDRSPMRKYEYSPFKQRQLIKTSHSTRNLQTGLNPNLYIKEMKDYQSNKRIGLETAPSSSKRKMKKQQNANIQVKPFNQYGIGMQINSQQLLLNNIEIADSNNNEYLHKRNSKQLNLLGLCPFEYDETIQGKMLRKSNHHIDFQRSNTNKIDNRNKVWYDYSKDIQKSGSLLQKQKQATLRKIHPFKSYSAHKLFAMSKNRSTDNGCGNGGMLDKFYNIMSPDIYSLTHQNFNKGHTNYQKMKSRSPLPVKLGTNLDYNTQELKSIGFGNNKRPILQMNQTQRKLVFSRQVISPKRGCFR